MKAELCSFTYPIGEIQHKGDESLLSSAACSVINKRNKKELNLKEKKEIYAQRGVRVGGTGELA